ncbi:MAG: hypothetical protein KAT77_05495 [Nanoarchaeota archaeon]|nr:hypothetical protein [Nanoarchaeota archaeon]
MLCEIKKIKPKSQDQRGEIFEFKSGSHVLVLKRKKGSISGAHYHLGKSKSKNPEIFFLAQGKVELYVEDIKTKENKTEIIEENTLIKIPAKIYHEVKGLTDFILLELKNQPDKYDQDTVRDYQK